MSVNQMSLSEEVRCRSPSPREEHVPRTGAEEEHVYVLTLKVTDNLAVRMNEMRERFFPKHLNRIPAHLTLFHALPHSQMHLVEASLSSISSNMNSFHVSAGKPFRIRRGVCIKVDHGYKELKSVYEHLRGQWLPFLSEQDASGGFRPHWTVMNKVNDEQRINEALDAIWKEWSTRIQLGMGTGLILWKYNGGDWLLAKEYLFSASVKRDNISGPS